MANKSLADFMPEKKDGPRLITTSLRLNEEIRDMLVDIAQEMETSQTNVVRALIRREHDSMFES